LALRSDRGVGADCWEQAIDKTLALNDLLARSEVVVMRIDGGGLDDLLGVAVLGRAGKMRQWILWSKVWAHRSVLERRKGEASVLRPAGPAHRRKLLHAVALDPYGVGAIVDALDEAGICRQDPIVGISQGWKLTGAIKTAERKLADGCCGMAVSA
jgi:phage terminase large subunit-like protein